MDEKKLNRGEPVSGRDMDIMQSMMGDTLTEMKPEERDAYVKRHEQENTEQEMLKKQPAPKQTPQEKAETEVEAQADNPVLLSLRRTFGLENFKEETIPIEGMMFTLKAVRRSLISWAETMAITMIVQDDGTYSMVQFQ